MGVCEIVLRVVAALVLLRGTCLKLTYFDANEQEKSTSAQFHCNNGKETSFSLSLVLESQFRMSLTVHNRKLLLYDATYDDDIDE